MLADELGLEPGPEVWPQDAILAQDPAIAVVPVVRRRHGNLPAPSTSFVGREDELGRVAGLLHEHRLVTLTGPPGVGKSRLAVETARSLEQEFPEGIWFVDFARAGGTDDADRLLAHRACALAPTRRRRARGPRGDRRARLSWQNRERRWQSVGSSAHEPSACQERIGGST